MVISLPSDMFNRSRGDSIRHALNSNFTNAWAWAYFSIEINTISISKYLQDSLIEMRY
jgi:hypothetical protein